MNKLFIIAAFFVLCTLFVSALADYKQDCVDFLAKKATEDGYKKTDSGIVYKVLNAGTGTKHPSGTSKVEVHYEGTLIDGTVFDSSYKRGQTISFPLNGVVKCWQEGVQLMTVGSKYELICPQALAYGSSNMGTIKPFSTLIFQVELFAIDGKKDEL